ncbi:MAG: hypothetical protein H0U13_05505, partial [Gemmatimonadaceae bacterium]|nr:hypothetical protein [Gemmatimonadaceae bacterium]
MHLLLRRGIVAALMMTTVAATGSCRSAAREELASGSLQRHGISTVEANDNRVPGGRLRDGTLNISLNVRMARWYPEAGDGPFVDVATFAEEG